MAPSGKVIPQVSGRVIECHADFVNGGFFDMGRLIDGKIEITNDHKSWWGIIEGFNALLLMHNLYPDDPNNYSSELRHRGIRSPQKI